MELSLDEVDVVVRGEVVDRFDELEVELLKGDEARLTALDGVLRADRRPAPVDAVEARVRRSPRSSGRAHRTGSAPDDRARAVDVGCSSRKSRPRQPGDSTGLPTVKTPGVTADDHVAEAARKVLRFHLARMLAREAGTREGKDAEELHAMRVATRRQRAAWRVFGDAFRRGRTKRYRSGLREIASRLGAVRDLDVLLDAADLYRADLPKVEQRSLEPLLGSWRQHRDDARVLLMRELDSDGYRRWVDDYRDFVRTEGAAVIPVGPGGAPSRPRHGTIPHLGRLRARPRL